MKHAFTLFALAVSLSVVDAAAQPAQGGQAAKSGTSVYHVHFDKAAPGRRRRSATV